eukprot:m.79322 g.79322  ORF g.79322 m.79322 type:complete len:54 (-) comp8600_c0_seq2:169-330(-)
MSLSFIRFPIMFILVILHGSMLSFIFHSSIPFIQADLFSMFIFDAVVIAVPVL